MRCACVDIGSNTTRLLVAECGDGLQAVLTLRAHTGLGAALRGTGAPVRELADRVAPEAARQVRAARRAGAGRLRVVGTAALRLSTHGPALCDAVRATAGVEVDVLDGAAEARLAFLGATRTLAQPPGGTVAVVDVGGGSTELAVGTLAGGVTWTVSLPVGSGVLAATHPLADPPTAAQLDALGLAVERALAGVAPPPVDLAVAVGGSAASLPRLAGTRLDAATVQGALATLRAAPAAAVAQRHGLAIERVRLLPAGLLLLGAAAERLGRPLHVGRGGLREGVCLELAGAPAP